MALEKRIELEYTVKRGFIEVTQDSQIWENGVFLSHSLHIHVLHPGKDTSQETPETQRIAAAVHTPEVVATFWEAERQRQLEFAAHLTGPE